MCMFLGAEWKGKASVSKMEIVQQIANQVARFFCEIFKIIWCI